MVSKRRIRVGRDKSDPGADFTDAQINTAKELASAYERLNPAQIEILVERGQWKEICNGNAKDACS